MNNDTPAPCTWRVRVFMILASGFFFQTVFVYSDWPRDEAHAELTPFAKNGLAIWRENNCQACHQIYGYGGFLGPDLTNLIGRRPDEDWTDILTRGRKQMPAFDFDEEERAAVVAFLREINETGTGIPSFTTVKEDADVNHLVRNYLKSTGGTADAAVLRGEELIKRNGCKACHPPFEVGTQGAPDMTLALSVRSPDYIRTILIESMGAMPAYDFLTDEQIDDMLAWMAWTRENRRALGLFYANKENGDAFRWAAVPWFEY